MTSRWLILRTIVGRVAHLTSRRPGRPWRRASWIIDGSFVPTRNHARAAKSKNYRWSCNLQLVIRRRDLHVLAIAGGGPGNRNDLLHYAGCAVASLCRQHGGVLADGGYRGIRELRTPRFAGRRMVRDRAWRRHRKRRARVEHAIARLKDWRVLRDYRRRGDTLVTAASAIAYLQNSNCICGTVLSGRASRA
jgi:hypothetical protein